MRRVTDVEQEAVAAARATGQANRRIDRDVVALVRPRLGSRRLGLVRADHVVHDRLHAGAQRGAVGRIGRRPAVGLGNAVEHRLHEPRAEHVLRSERVGGEAARRPRRICLALGFSDVLRHFAVRRRLRQRIEDARAADHGRLLRRGERHLDHFDPEQRAVRIRVGRLPHAAGELGGRAHRRRAGNVDVHVVRVFGIDHDRVRMRSAARLHVREVLGTRDVGDVEDANAAEALMRNGVVHALAAAIESPAESLTGDEQQVAIYRDVALRRRAEVGVLQSRPRRRRDVPDLESIVVALDHVVLVEREIGVRGADEFLRWRDVGDQLEIAGRLTGILQSCPQAHARVRSGSDRRIIPSAPPGGAGGKRCDCDNMKQDTKRFHCESYLGEGDAKMSAASIRCIRSISVV